MSDLAQLIAMMDPGVYEDRKQTMGDVGPWPGRMDDAFLSEKAEMDKLMPGLQYAMSGAGALTRIGGSRGAKRQGVYEENYKNIENDPSDRVEFLKGLTNAHEHLKGESSKTPLKDIYRTYGKEFVSEDAFKNLLGGFYKKQELPGLTPSDPRFNSPGTGYRSETGPGTWSEFFRYLRDVK
jgi:hypothetical protein